MKDESLEKSRAELDLITQKVQEFEQDGLENKVMELNAIIDQKVLYTHILTWKSI